VDLARRNIHSSDRYPDTRAQLWRAPVISMSRLFKVGDHVSWNSEAGRIRGTIVKVVTSKIKFKGYTVHASAAEPQYQIKSDKTDHIAMHKGSALRKLSS
jgi:hypothetical protein